MIPGVQNPHWLAPVATKASAHRPALGRGHSLEGGDAPAGDPPGRRHAGDPGGAVDEHGAAAALALWAAPVLHAAQPEPVAEHLEERGAVVGHLDLAAVDLQRQGHRWRLMRGSRSASGRPDPRAGTD